MNIRPYVRSMRLRTVPQSLSGIIFGIALASTVTRIDFAGAFLLLLTAALLQILSNLSNELGDTLHGTDKEGRQGMIYSLQGGEMSVSQMKRFISIIVTACCMSGLMMIFFCFGTLFSIWSGIFIILGAFTIWAAMKYTLGKHPYGYIGLGDLFVFIFFGLVPTVGGAFLCSLTFRPLWILPAAAMGCFSVGVLNINNIRDMKTDEATRVTVAMKLGQKNARIYQTVLIVLGWVLLLSYTSLTADRWPEYLYLVTIPLFAINLAGVWKRTDRQLDPMLPMLVLTTFATAILFLIGI